MGNLKQILKSCINQIRAIICLWLLDLIYLIAPDDGLKESLAIAVLDISIAEIADGMGDKNG